MSEGEPSTAENREASKLSAGRRARRAALLVCLLAPAAVALWIEPLTRPDPEALRLRSTTYLTDRKARPVRFLTDERWRRHLWIDAADIPDTVRRAFLSAEDERFYDHPGFDAAAIVRAALSNLRAGRVVSGASTLTQQLVKSARGGPRTLPRKFLEAVEAARLERILSKEEILTLYLNRVDLANNLLGVEAAARAYFGKRASALDEVEAATLAALPKAPTRLDPWGENPERLLERRNWVLGRMAELGYLTREAAESGGSRPLGVRAAEQPMEASHLVDQLASSGRLEGLSGEVALTLDLDLQHDLESVLRSHRSRLAEGGASQAAALILDNRTLELLALAGSFEYAPRSQGFVNGADARRSAGSTLKPFLYGLAVEHGYAPASVLEDIEQAYRSDDGEYLPLNFDRQTHGPVNLRLALGKSLNLPAIRMLNRLGWDEVYALFRRLELLPGDSPPPEFYGLGLAVGNPEVRLTDLAAAYAALANGGVYRPIRMVSSEPAGETRRVMTTEAAFLVTDILSDPLVRSASFARFPPPEPVALKTGTSTHYRDGWTVGFTRRYTVAVWVGNFDGRETFSLYGGIAAGPIFCDVMKSLYPAEPPASFAPPDTVTQLEVCAQSGALLLPSCRERKMDSFVSGCEPTTPCSFHGAYGGRHDLPATYAGWLENRHSEGRESRYRLAGATPDLDRLFLPPPPRTPAIYDGPVRIGAPEETTAGAPESDLRILYPLDGDRYLLSPGEESIPLRLEAAAEIPLERVEWFVDGEEIGEAPPPYTLLWEAGRGRHRVMAVDGNGFGRVVEVTVE